MAYYLCKRTLFLAMTKICQSWNLPLLTVNSEFCCFFFFEVLELNDKSGIQMKILVGK